MSDETIPSTPELAAIEALPKRAPRDPACDTYWGSHGCDREAGHPMPHVCGLADPEDGVCSVHDGTSVRFVMGAGVSGEQAGIGEDIAAWMLGAAWAMPTFGLRDGCDIEVISASGVADPVARIDPS